MHITINRAELLAAVKHASAIAPPDSPLDVLRGVLLETDSADGISSVFHLSGIGAYASCG